MAENNNNNDVTYIDAEYQTTGNEKIDFKSILFKQIDYIRYLRTQDMGEFSLYDIDLVNTNNIKPELLIMWVKNSSTYQNAVKSLQNVLISYEDETYRKNIVEINKKYDLKLNNGINVIKNKYSNIKAITKKTQEKKEQELIYIKRMYAMVQIPKKYDDIFRECILIMNRVGFIGGYESVIEEG